MHVFYLCEHLYVSICCFYLLTPSHSKLLSFSQGVTSPWLSWEYVSQIPLLTPPRFPTVLTWASSREATLSVPARTQTRIDPEGPLSPERAIQLWAGRGGVKSRRSSGVSSRENSALTLTDSENENKSDDETGKSRDVC